MTQIAPQVQAWLTALEMERYDTSYRNPKPVKEPAAEAPKRKPRKPYVQKPQAEDTKEFVNRVKRDKIFYDAGRFAAGHRDADAVAAFQRLNRAAS
jgi:hypothetical protein